MRVALILLFLLALAAVPGSIFPQRAVNPIAVTDYFRAHPQLAPLLDRLSLFNVFAAPWFAAIYLLLFISLVGCVIPRMIQHLVTARAAPPPAPRNLARLPQHRTWTTTATPGDVAAAARTVLRRSRFRVADTVRPADPRTSAGIAVSAEKGYLREVGNLLFHASLVLLLVAFAMGKLLGYRGSVLVVEGQGFANTITQYDTFNPGRLFDTSSLPPFSLRLDRFITDYDPRTAAPTRFVGQVTYRKAPDAPAQAREIRVNHPLEVGGTKVFLGARGYAAVVTVREANGDVVFKQAVPFLTQDVSTMTGQGVIKVPDARPTQLGFQGFLLPTAVVHPQLGPVSVFPALKNPQLYITGWKGDLGLDSGIPQSVYRLDTHDMTQLRDEKEPGQPWAVALAPGESAKLPGGLGSITLDEVRPWVNLDLADDPGLPPALVAATLALLGLLLSLSIRRRRVWVRATRSEPGHTVVEMGALAPTESAALAGEVDRLVSSLRDATSPPPPDPGEALDPDLAPAPAAPEVNTQQSELAQNSHLPDDGTRPKDGD
jgi:cytochrome c biogenesis protein